MRVTVLVFLYFKGLAMLFEEYRDININVLVSRIVFIIFDKTACIFPGAFHEFTFAVYQVIDTDIVFLTYFIVIRTECRSGMYDTGTIFCGYEIAQDHAERITAAQLRLIAVEWQ
ncbi:hypothetical protein D3C72_1477570 [compost metagenome]